MAVALGVWGGVVGEVDEDLVAFDAEFEGSGGEAGDVGAGAVGELERPEVAAAEDGVAVDVAEVEGLAHVWAVIVDGVELLAYVEEGDAVFTDGEGLGLALGDVGGLGDGDEVGHLYVLSHPKESGIRPEGGQCEK